MENVLGHVEDCVDTECSVEDVDQLISRMKKEQEDLTDKLARVRTMIKSLETVNGRDENVITETMRAIFRLFQFGDEASGNDYPALSNPPGWTGEIGDGPKTAYDVLPPKPYKKPSP